MQLLKGGEVKPLLPGILVDGEVGGSIKKYISAKARGGRSITEEGSTGQVGAVSESLVADAGDTVGRW